MATTLRRRLDWRMMKQQLLPLLPLQQNRAHLRAIEPQRPSQQA
jgi:hypothetical protein